MQDYRPPRCRNCGAILRAEKSIERGFGATCGLEFAHLWMKSHPKYMGEKAKKRWTKEEIVALMEHIKLERTKQAAS